MGALGGSLGALGALLRVLGVKMSSKRPFRWIVGRFGKVLGWFWETKILNFRSFLDVFSKSILKHFSEDEKMDQNFEKTKVFRFLVEGRR